LANFRLFIIAGVVTVLAFFTQAASGNKLMDYIRSTDLNDFALGAALSTSQNPYKQSENSAFFYPYLTSFRHDAFTDTLFIVGESEVGVRKVFDNDWVLGVVGRIQTLGLGENELIGVEERRWTLELAPLVTYRRWPVHLNLQTYFEILDRHQGFTSEFELSYPMEWPRGYLVPTFDLIYESDEFTDYYYGVSPSEAAPGRSAYQPGSALNLELGFQFGYALTGRWLLSGGLSIEKLDDQITSSPIIDRDHLWSANIGLAYNANVFKPRAYEYSRKLPRTLVRFSALDAQLETTLTRASGGEVSLEELLGLSDKKTVGQFDITVRLSGYHRLEMGYTRYSRSGFAILGDDLSVGDARFIAGTELDVSVETKVLRLAYGYSILMDEQKELGVMAGIHRTDIDVRFFAPDSGLEESRNPSPLLPVMGLYGNVNLFKRTRVSAEVQFFRLDFDRWNGSLSSIRLDVQQVIGRLGIGLGYSYYIMDLESNNQELVSSLEFRHQGPFLFATISF